MFNFIVQWTGWVEPAGLDLALAFTRVLLGGRHRRRSLWHRRFGIGPAEWVYRKIGG